VDDDLAVHSLMLAEFLVAAVRDRRPDPVLAALDTITSQRLLEPASGSSAAGPDH
jgi:hypothetical protein